MGGNGKGLGLSGTTKEIVNFGDLAGNLFITSCIMARESALSSLGGFDEALRHGEDWDLWLRMTRMGFYIRCAPGSRVEYRQHPQSLSHSALHEDFVLRKRVAEIAWSRDERCTNPLPEFESGLGSAIRLLGDTQRAFSAYVSCLFMSHTTEGNKLFQEVNINLLRISDPRVVADASKYSILRNAGISKANWDAFRDERKHEVIDQATAQLPKELEKFAESYFSILFT